MSLRRLLLLGFVACLPIVHPAVAADDAPEATLTVSGKSTLKVPADQVSLMLGVEAASADPDQAHADASATMDALVKAMKKLGLKPVPSSRSSVHRRSAVVTRPRNADPTWRPTIVGYRVSSSMQITTTRIELAGTLIANAVDAGANDIGQLVFGLADPPPHGRGDRCRDAECNRRCQATGRSRRRRTSLDPIPESRRRRGDAKIRKVRSSCRRPQHGHGRPDPPVMSGDVTVHANVTLVWNISGP